MSVEKTLRVQVNGEGREVRDRATLNDLVGELSLAPARIAVELNHQVVRRDKWSETILSEDDRIEIVHFVGGGMGKRPWAAVDSRQETTPGYASSGSISRHQSVESS